MRVRLVPLFFPDTRDGDFDVQVANLRQLLQPVADILDPVALGAPLPAAEAVVFPQFLGEAFRRVKEFQAIQLPILVVTSEFGTVSMWDWEIANFLEAQGVETVRPYNLEQTLLICRMLGVKRALNESTFLVFQDNPGEGFQPSIFKRFYWWEDECTQRILEKFGVKIVKQSFQALGAQAKLIPDHEADAAWHTRQVPTAGLSTPAVRSAFKLYLAIRREMEHYANVGAVGINCLNESHYSDTTPCLAWNLLFEEQQLIWGCEADTVSMLTKYILHKSLDVPIMMTNLYPFLMGQAALKHERISDFPNVVEPENCLLVAHCGYLGVVPQSFADEWTLRPKVLAIVDDNASAIDARLPTGDVTLAKLDASMDRMTVMEGALEQYVQYPGSDCLNGGMIRVPDGRRMMENLSSHHYLIMTGHNAADLGLLGKVFGLAIEQI